MRGLPCCLVLVSLSLVCLPLSDLLQEGNQAADLRGVILDRAKIARPFKGQRLLCLRLQRGAACAAGDVMAWARGRRRGGARARRAAFGVGYLLTVSAARQK